MMRSAPSATTLASSTDSYSQATSPLGAWRVTASPRGDDVGVAHVPVRSWPLSDEWAVVAEVDMIVHSMLRCVRAASSPPGWGQCARE